MGRSNNWKLDVGIERQLVEVEDRRDPELNPNHESCVARGLGRRGPRTCPGRTLTVMDTQMAAQDVEPWQAAKGKRGVSFLPTTPHAEGERRTPSRPRTQIGGRGTSSEEARRHKRRRRRQLAINKSTQLRLR